MKVVWTPDAESDLTKLGDYLAQDNPRAAIRLGQRIFDSGLRLAQFPRRGRPGRVDGTRELPIPSLPWLLIYTVDAEQVRILRVLHGARDWPPSAIGPDE